MERAIFRKLSKMNMMKPYIMKKLFNLLGIVLISMSIVSCGGEEVDDVNAAEPENVLILEKGENKKELLGKIEPKCALDAKEFQINNNIISSLTLSKIECKENYNLDSEIRDLLNKDNQITFLKNQENEVSGETEGYKIKIGGVIQISKNEYNASLYYTPMSYEKRIEFDGILILSLKIGEFAIKTRGSKKK